MALKVAISAGELSGDSHASKLVEALRHFSPEIELRGMGGRNLKAANVELVVNSEKSAGVMGITEIFSKLGVLAFAFRRMTNLLKSWRPDLLIIVDFPDFNLRLARYAKRCGIPVLYYIPPKVWAWRESRVRYIKRYVDMVVSILPFEREFYERHGFNRITYVGHPFTDDMSRYARESASTEGRKEFFSKLKVDSEKPIIAILPGSRSFEVKRHLEVALRGVKLLRENHPQVQVVVSIAPTIKAEKVNALLPKEFRGVSWLDFYQGSSHELMCYADVGLIKSGTSNLEAAMCNLPFVMFYKVSAFTEQILKRLLKIKQFSLVNIIRPDTVTELVQHDLNPQKIAFELDALLFNPAQRTEVETGLAEVRSQLHYDGNPEAFTGCTTAASRAAKLSLEIAREKRVAKREVTRRVLSYLRPYTWEFVLALLCMVIFGATDGAVPFVLKKVLDGIFTDRDKDLLYLIPVALFVFAIVRAAFDFLQMYLMSKVGHNIVKDIRDALNRHLLAVSSDFFSATTSGNLLSRVTSDVILVRTLLTDALASVIRDSIRVVALLVAAIWLDPWLAIIAFLAFPIGVLPVYRFGRRMRKLSKRGQEEIGALTSMLQESISGYRVVKAFGREEFEAHRFEEKNKALTNIFLKSERVRALVGPINEILATVAISTVILYGGLSVLENARNQSSFIAFLVSVFLLYDPFRKLSRVNSSVQQGIAGAERLFEILDRPPTVQDPLVPVSLGRSNTIELIDVDFAYNADTELVISDVSLTIEEGEKVAIVGLSGAGKSTLVDLIPRFIDPKRGEVRIGGVDISKVLLSELRNRIAMVGQHTFLFNDTVFNNIAYGRAGASYEDVVAAAKAAFAYDFIIELKDGFEAMIGEDGCTLSGGQRQRIAIARAILKNSPILILDEATASLDNQSELEVQRALEELERDRTCVVIAHRLSTVRNADRIIVMRQGKIVEQGTHENLLQAEGEYAKLYELQFAHSVEGVAIERTVN